MRRAAAAGTGTQVVALAIVLAALVSWAGAAGTPAPVAGSLSLGAHTPATLDFVPAAGSAPSPRGPERLPPLGGPFLLVAALPDPGTYVLSVQMVADAIDAATGARVAPADLRYEARPVGPSAPEGCSSTPWRSVGGGSRVAVLHGPGVCRLRIRLSWSWNAGAAPGRYRGALRWLLSSAAP